MTGATPFIEVWKVGKTNQVKETKKLKYEKFKNRVVLFNETLYCLVFRLSW